MMGLLFKLPEIPEVSTKGMLYMSSSRCKINAKTVRRTIKNEHITGVSLEVCAINIAQRLNLGPECKRKTLEMVKRLANNGEIIIDDANLRLTTDDERMAAKQDAYKLNRRMTRARARTRAVRSLTKQQATESLVTT